jgi:PIN domain nuclease of toxin-antitoxin system
MGALRLLLDTHALVWWLVAPDRLPRRVLDALSAGTTEVYASAASGWELATKSRLGKLGDAADLLEDLPGAMEDDGIRVLDVTLAHALLAGTLPGEHRDPFDRMLAAQSRLEGLPLVTADKAFAQFGTSVFW